MPNKLKYLQVSLFVFTLGLIAGYSVFEYHHYSSQASEEKNLSPIIEKSLEKAEALFNEIYDNFEQTHNQIYNEVTGLLLPRQSRIFIYNALAQYDLWGITLYKNDHPWVWSGFEHPIRPASSSSVSDQNTTSIQRRNNVTFLLNQIRFTVEDDTYDLLTAKKLEQTSNLPYVQGVTSSISAHPELNRLYPVTFNFFNPLPENALHRTLSTSFSDSAGTVFATLEKAEEYHFQQQKSELLYRGIFHVVLFFLLYMMLLVWIIYASVPSLRVVLLLLSGFIWFALTYTGITSYWANLYQQVVQTAGMPMIHEVQINYLIHSLFLLLISVGLHQLLKLADSMADNESHYQTIACSVLYGALNMVLLLFFILSTRQLLIESRFPLLDLELAPAAQSLLFYLTSAIFLTAISAISIALGYFIYLREQNKSAIIAVITIISFIIFFYFADFFLEQQLFINQIFLLAAILLLIFLFVIHSLYKNPSYFGEMSGFRRLMLLVFVVSTSVYVIIWDRYNDRMDRELLQKIEEFSDEQTQEGEMILEHLLARVEHNLQSVTREDLDENRTTVQAGFLQTVQESIETGWKAHSFNIQFLDTDGEQISEFSTSLDSPLWTVFFSTDLMLRTHRGEQLRRETNRPIIWGRPQQLSERFISLDRGWIPIYDASRSGNIIAWIAGDVYRERPDYNKPMRAVLSAASADEWKQSFYLAEFLGERLTRNAVHGIYKNQPQYHRLPERETEIAQGDSITFITNITAQGSFREVLVRKPDRKIVKASTPFPGLNQHIFSYFRLQITLVFFGLFCFSILAMSGFRFFNLFGQSRKFKHRLTDGLTLATIIFLSVLIITTQLAIGIQNEKNVERELVNKLNILEESLRGDISSQTGIIQQLRLPELASPLNADAIFYVGPNMAESTTSQVFQQHLMPRFIPYPAYDFLYNRERRHYISSTSIGTEELLIGYRAVLDEENNPAAAVAIPTFLQSPVYKEQLLETTSYLFVAYLIIFTLFILGSLFLSNQLTKPLQLIQSGLNKISRGNMETQVPVTSRDEIGSLAKAYNKMVDRLDQAQRELLRAEREAAWKEMAQQVAHEIKNPLTPMKLNLQHLQRQLESNPENVMELKPLIERTAANVIEQIESLNKIASDFSKFSKPMQEPLQPVEFSRITDSISELYRHDVTVSVDVKFPKGNLTVMAVEEDLRRALINLVKNGIESHQDDSAMLQILVKKQNETLLVQITDQGSGIAPEDRNRIFVPNFSTKSSGTGLGLAITKKIIEAHNGEIWFESENGNGTSFYIRLPLQV